MEHTKKFLLVPEERINQLNEEHLTDLDRQMNAILKRKNLSDEEKAVLYLQILQKYVKFPFILNSDKTIESESETNTMITEENTNLQEGNSTEDKQMDSKDTDDVVTEILNAAPLKQKKTVRNIINFLQASNSKVFWTPDKELLVNGRVYRDTNIVDLVVHLIRNRKMKPNGFNVFHDSLSQLDFPETWIKNKYLKNKIYAKPLSWYTL